ncbi:helix-turn-helix transcriptional regulator [Bilophila wadsworthia]
MEENPLCPFGDVLVKARKDRDITQYRLAKLTKRSARYISMLEHNAREQQLSTGLLLARALRMDAGNWPATLTHSCRKDGDPG